MPFGGMVAAMESLPGHSRDRPGPKHDVWVTGVGLLSSHGVGAAAHRDALAGAALRRHVSDGPFAPYTIFPLAGIDFADQIPNKADQRQMGLWQRIGVFGAGLALADARIKGDPNLLARTDLLVAAGNGERDSHADARIFDAIAGHSARQPLINALQTSLRPTLYLGELSNLLAGNISIVHGVTRSSRTFKGEEQAGVAAFEDAVCRIGDGTSRLALVGGACNAERHDLLLSMELCKVAWHGGFASVRQRGPSGGGIIPGSVGAFVVLEAAEHARSRGIQPYAQVACVASGRRHLPPAGPVQASATLQAGGQLLQKLAESPAAILSGASGAQPAFDTETAWLETLDRAGLSRGVRFYGDIVGHGFEAHFLTGVALAAIEIAKRDGDPDGGKAAVPRVLVTGFGQWRGAGAALLEAIEADA